eukprot:COSAG04_NODE_29495_length_268_cov_1.029586_1_plen_82_part_01
MAVPSTVLVGQSPPVRFSLRCCVSLRSTASHGPVNNDYRCHPEKNATQMAAISWRLTVGHNHGVLIDPLRLVLLPLQAVHFL